MTLTPEDFAKRFVPESEAMIKETLHKMFNLLVETCPVPIGMKSAELFHQDIDHRQALAFTLVIHEAWIEDLITMAYFKLDDDIEVRKN